MTSSITVSLPKGLVDIIKQRGLDIESFVLEAVVEKLARDPQEEYLARLRIARYMLERAEEELARRDAVQASEKLYKAVEECIKVLACMEGLEECERAHREGGWWTKLLARAASRLARRLGNQLIVEAWEAGYNLHVHGFHEHALDVEDVEARLSKIKKLVDYTEHRVARGMQGLSKA